MQTVALDSIIVQVATQADGLSHSTEVTGLYSHFKIVYLILAPELILVLRGSAIIDVDKPLRMLTLAVPL